MGITSKKDHTFDGRVKLPVDQATPANRDIWYDSAEGKLAFKIGGTEELVPLADEISAGITVSDTSSLNLTLAAGDISGAVLDSPKLEGNTLAQVQTAIVSAIVAGASSAYDTLIELQGLLQDNDNDIAILISSVAARAKFFAGTVPNGNPTANIDHNLALTNIHDFTCKVFVAATGVEEEYAAVGSTSNRVILTDETGANIASGRRIFLTAGA